MFDKKILGVAVAAAMCSTSAMAVVDLTVKPVVPAYTAEELTSAGTPAIVTLTNTTVWDIATAVGVGITNQSGVSRYVRYNLSGDNAIFVAAPAVSFAGAGTGSVSVVAGGIGVSWAIVELTESAAGAGADIAPADKVTLKPVTIAVDSTATDITVTTATYADLSSAATEIGALATDSGTHVDFTASSTYTFTPNTTAPQATIDSDFDEFTPVTNVTTATSGNLGDLAWTKIDPDGAQTGTYLADASQTSLIGDLVGANSTLTIVGSFDTADIDAIPVQLSDNTNDCADVTAPGAAYTAVVAADKQSVVITALDAAGITLIGDSAVCYNVDGATAILATPGYAASTGFTAGADGTSASGSGSLAGLTRQGSTAQIAYLTTFVDYNQRIYLTNRSPTDADYSITFTSESGVTATPGSAATGTIPAGEVLAIKASDVVTLTGRTRTSATLTVEANAGFIDATTQTVNLSNGGTDTVELSLN